MFKNGKAASLSPSASLRTDSVERHPHPFPPPLAGEGEGGGITNPCSSTPLRNTGLLTISKAGMRLA